MDDWQQQIEQLESDIARREAAIGALETEIAELERELSEFGERYNRVIQPIITRTQAVKDAITEIEKQRRLAHLEDAPQKASPPPSNYVPVEEQYRRAWEAHAEDAPPLPRAKPKTNGDDPAKRLKTLYRQLARRYHPDLAQDEADRQHRTKLMALINEAYANHDFDALKALDEAVKPNTAAPQPSAAVPLGVLRLRRLQQINGDLLRQIADLEHDRSDLLNSNLMDLKIEVKLAKMRGRDLLREMAERMQREYQTHMEKLDQLRHLF